MRARCTRPRRRQGSSRRRRFTGPRRRGLCLSTTGDASRWPPSSIHPSSSCHGRCPESPRAGEEKAAAKGVGIDGAGGGRAEIDGAAEGPVKMRLRSSPRLRPGRRALAPLRLLAQGRDEVGKKKRKENVGPTVWWLG
jgi:hypothetical protein